MEWVWVWVVCLFTAAWAWAWGRVSVGQMGTTVTQMPVVSPSTMQLDVEGEEEEVVVEAKSEEARAWGALVLVTTVRMVVNSVAVGTMMVE